MDKVKLFDVNEMEWKRDWPRGLASCVLKMSPEATLQFWELPPGGGADPHSHPESQLTYCQSGMMKLWVGEEEYVVGPGCFAYIPSNVVHATENIGSQTVVNIDFFLPDREDRFDSEKVREFGRTCKPVND